MANEAEKTEQNKVPVAEPGKQPPAAVVEPKPEAQAQAQDSAPAQEQQQAQPDKAQSEKAAANLAFIKQRQKIKALEAALKAKEQTPQAAQPPTPTEARPGQAQEQGSQAASVDPSRLKAEILAELRQAQQQTALEAQRQEAEETALKQLAEDKDLSAMPDGIVQALNLIDTDPRISRINAIDPVLALREAKAEVLTKSGKTPRTSAPISHPGGGGSMPQQISDLDTLDKKLKTLPPRSKEWYATLKQIEESARKH